MECDVFPDESELVANARGGRDFEVAARTRPRPSLRTPRWKAVVLSTTLPRSSATNFEPAARHEHSLVLAARINTAEEDLRLHSPVRVGYP